MPMLRAIRLFSSISAGTTSGGQLETLLADPGRLSDFSQLLTLRSYCQLLAASDTAMTAVVDSPTAMAAIAANLSAIEAIIDRPSARAVVAASPSAIEVMVESPYIVEATTVGNTSQSSTIYLTMSASHANNIQVIPGATGRAIVVAAKLNNTGAGSAAPLNGFPDGTAAWTWDGTNKVPVMAAVSIPNTGTTVSFRGSSTANRIHTIYYIPV